MQKAKKPSMTARKVALSIVTLGAKSGMDKILPSGIVEATADMLIASGTVSANIIRLARSRRMVSVYESFDWMLPGQFEAFAHRKAFFEHQVRKGINQGATQVLVLGAGYDTMGWRLAPEFPGVNFYEIDHQTTAQHKAKAVETLGQRKNLYLIAEELGERKLSQVLTATGLWGQNASTVIVTEGLVMYLPAHAVRDLFHHCALITGIGSRIAFSYIPTGVDNRIDAGRWTSLLLWLQKIVGEPWLWSIRPKELGLFLKDSGWPNVLTLPETSQRHGVEFYAVASK